MNLNTRFYLNRILNGIAKIELIWVLSAISFSCVIGLYFKVFKENEWALNPSAWGQFGDYLGGVFNPFVGLITIYLISKTLRQNDHLLRSTSTQLKETQKLKIFNQAIEFIDIYNNKIVSINNKITSYNFNNATPSMLEDAASLKRELILITEKRDSLIHLIDQEYDVLVAQLCQDLIDRSSNIDGFIYGNFEFDVSYAASFSKARLKIKSIIDNKVKIDVIIDGTDQEKELLARRGSTIDKVQLIAMKMIDDFEWTGEWTSKYINELNQLKQ